jgi:transcriptional regulator with XRE-family HTH domain
MHAGDIQSEVQGRALARFGVTIRQMRLARGLTGSALGRLAFMSQSQVSKIEKGRRLPTITEVANISRALQLSDSEYVELLAEHSVLTASGLNHRLVQRAGYAPNQIYLQEIEEFAVLNRQFGLSILPGLLQTEQYARGLLGNLALSADDINASVRIRVNRQRVLWEPQHRFEFLIFETGFYAIYCDIADHLAQLDRIRTLARRPNIDIGFVQARVTPSNPLSSTFEILDNALVIVEGLLENSWIINPQDILRCHLYFDQISCLAVRGTELDAAVEEAIDVISSYRN